MSGEEGGSRGVELAVGRPRVLVAAGDFPIQDIFSSQSWVVSFSHCDDCWVGRRELALLGILVKDRDLLTQISLFFEVRRPS